MEPIKSIGATSLACAAISLCFCLYLMEIKKQQNIYEISEISSKYLNISTHLSKKLGINYSKKGRKFSFFLSLETEGGEEEKAEEGKKEKEER